MKERRERWLSSEFTWTQQCNLLLFTLSAVVQSYSSISYQNSQANTYFHLSKQSKHTVESATLACVHSYYCYVFVSVCLGSLHYDTVLNTELGLVCREAEVLLSDRSVLEPHFSPQTLQKHQKQQWQVSICRPEGLGCLWDLRTVQVAPQCCYDWIQSSWKNSRTRRSVEKVNPLHSTQRGHVFGNYVWSFEQFVWS